MEALQLRARLDADLVDQRVARVPVRLERLRLAAAAVERQDPLRVEMLAQGILGQQCVDLRDDLLVAAGGQVGVDRQLGRGQPQLFEPPDLGDRERFVGHVGERVAAEQRQRLARRVSVRRSRRLRDEPLEPEYIHQLAIDLELVRAPAGEDLHTAVVGEHLAQPPDVVLHHLGRARRGLLAPETFDQPVSRDRPVGLQTEHRQHGALLRSAEGTGRSSTLASRWPRSRICMTRVSIFPPCRASVYSRSTPPVYALDRPAVEPE